MRRLHLFEFTDLPWWPDALRALATDYLRTVLHWLRPFDGQTARIAAALRAGGAVRVVDLCSGSGGPWPDLIAGVRERLGAEVSVLLTDRYPHPVEDGLDYWREPVDARAVPRHMVGLRTLFDGFHHFRPADARAVLRDAVRAGQPVAVFEVSRRAWPSLGSALLIPLLVLVATPWVRPFRWSRLAWTYLVPIAPLAIAWDGAVSHLRAYTEAELRDLARAAGGDTFVWQVGTDRAGRMPVTYLVGVPSAAATASPQPEPAASRRR